MNAVLKRSSLPEIDPLEHMTQEVLEYSHKELGYHHPQKQHLCREGSLAKALRVAGIKPFSNDSVRAYKRSQVTHINRLKRFMRPLFLVAGIALSVGVTSAVIRYNTDVVNWRTICGIIGCIASGAFLLSFVGSIILFTFEEDATWKLVPLKDYPSPVPGFALATAKEIHQRVPGASFYIDELVIEDRQHDPFLVVEWDGALYYVEVWEEPRYEQSRKV